MAHNGDNQLDHPLEVLERLRKTYDLEVQLGATQREVSQLGIASFLLESGNLLGENLGFLKYDSIWPWWNGSHLWSNLMEYVSFLSDFNLRVHKVWVGNLKFGLGVGNIMIPVLGRWVFCFTAKRCVFLVKSLKLFQNIGPQFLLSGCFLKWWYPRSTPKWSFLVGKPMVVGYHHFRKSPSDYCIFFGVFFLNGIARSWWIFFLGRPMFLGNLGNINPLVASLPHRHPMRNSAWLPGPVR